MFTVLDESQMNKKRFEDKISSAILEGLVRFRVYVIYYLILYHTEEDIAYAMYYYIYDI